MKKELKDFLHFYLGCKCQPTDGTKAGKLMGLRIMEGCENAFIQYTGQSNLIPFKIHEIMPILRRISDITEEERLTAYRVKAPSPSFERNALVTQHLLSEYFDLFGLIEAGIAIDATTIKAEI